MRIIIALTMMFVSGCALSQRHGGRSGNSGAIPQDTTKRSRPAPEADCGMDLEYDEEADLILHKKSLMPYTGVCRAYYEDNRLEREAYFVDGKEDGRSVTYYMRYVIDKETGRKMRDDSATSEPGQTQVITEFKMGVPEGKWQYFYPDGKTAWINYYKEGKKDDIWYFYYDDGKMTPKKEESWKEDKKNGTFKEYFKNGNVKSEINYVNDYMDGAYILYYEDGKEFMKKTFKQGKEDGEVLSYHKNGQTASISRYVLGVPEGTWYTYFDDGKEMSVVTYINGKKEGEYKEYHKDGGQLKKRIVYKAGKVVSMEEFDEFGNKIEKGVNPEDD